jgi:5-methylcytosine-specific restriction endonuclease McrA
MKTCSKCKVEKDESAFRARKDRPCGLRSQCRACDLKYNDTEAGQDAARKYRTSHKGKLHLLSRMKRFQKTTKGKQVRERYRVSDKGRASNVASHARRRDKIASLDENFTRQDALLVRKRFNKRCFNCGSCDGLQIDHHYPLSKGYALSLRNAVLLCKSCNSSKHDKMPEEFYSQDKLEILTTIFSE